MKKDCSINFIIWRNWRVFIFAFLLFPFAFAPVGAMHRYHTSLTRIDYNAKEKLIEITIRLFTHDLIPVLEQKYKKSFDLEKTPDVDKNILEYLNETFILKDKNSNALKLVWVGKELETDTALIYVEVSSSENLEGMSLQNTIFFETFAEQTNLVIARSEEKKADLIFKVGDKIKEISFASAKK